MKIVVLHWHGICPYCNRVCCIYREFHRDEDGMKWPDGFRCGSCDTWISEDIFDSIDLIEGPCPKEIIREE